MNEISSLETWFLFSFSWKPEGKKHLEDKGVDGSILLKWISNEMEDVDWIQLSQDTVRWRARVL